LVFVVFFDFLVFWFLGFLVFACPTSFAIPLPSLRLIRSCFARASHPIRSVSKAVPNDDLSLSAAIEATEHLTLRELTPPHRHHDTARAAGYAVPL